MKKLLRITTVSLSLDLLLKGQLGFLNQYYDVVGIASGIEKLRIVSKREGIRVINIHIEREVKILKDIRSLFDMIRVINQEKPNIVHANTPKGSLLAMVAAMICRVPHRIYTVTGLRFDTTTGLYKKLLVLMEQITCACATKVIPEGEGVKKTLLRENITKKSLQKILNGNINGIDLSYFDRSPDVITKVKEIRNEDYFTFVFVGRLVREKGINELVKAFNRLSNEMVDINPMRLFLVGWYENELDPLLPETILTIKNNSEIHFLGFHEDVRPFLAAADALVFPSYREGFPGVVLQAGAMGLPGIVTDINGCNEIIIEGINGIIIPPKDEQALYNGMCSFVENKDKVKEMAGNSRKLIASRFDQNMLWQALLEEYQKLE